MRKVGIVADTAASIPEDLIQEYEINMIPLLSVFPDKTYRDRVDIKEASQLFELIDKADKFPTSSAPSPTDYLSFYRELGQKKVDNILCVTVSSEMSMCFKSATMAKEMAQSELPKVNIEIFDSRTTMGSFGLIVLAAARAAAEGKDIDQVIKAASEVRDRVNCVVLFDTLSYLAKSGRVGRGRALMGNILSIKPIVEVSTSTGVVEPVTRVRTRPKAIKHLLEIVRRRSRPGDKMHFSVDHTIAADEAEKLGQMVSEEFDCAEVLICETQPVAALITGPKMLGLSFYGD
jgi:DegV family protein with EDD domain